MEIKPQLVDDEFLSGLPSSLRNELMRAYEEILKNYRERRWEPSELNGGKLCEIVYSILRGCADEKFPHRATKPRNFVDACRKLEESGAHLSRSVRIQIPRMLIALYEVRNNRGVGHVGGDVDPNHMDATCVVEMSKWILSELVRIFHDVTTEAATEKVESLIERTNPLVWKIGENLRVLNPSLSMKDKVLALLYHSSGSVGEGDLFRWVEHSNLSVFRRDVLRRAHRSKLIEFNEDIGFVVISPIGVDYVESQILLKF